MQGNEGRNHDWVCWWGRAFRIHTGSVVWWRLLEFLAPLAVLHLHEQHLPFLEMVDMQTITKTGQHKTAKTHSKQRKPQEPPLSSSNISPSLVQKSSSQTFTHRQHVSHTSSLLSSEQQQLSPISIYQCFSIGIVTTKLVEDHWAQRRDATMYVYSHKISPTHLHGGRDLSLIPCFAYSKHPLYQ